LPDSFEAFTAASKSSCHFTLPGATLALTKMRPLSSAEGVLDESVFDESRLDEPLDEVLDEVLDELGRTGKTVDDPCEVNRFNGDSMANFPMSALLFAGAISPAWHNPGTKAS